MEKQMLEELEKQREAELEAQRKKEVWVTSVCQMGTVGMPFVIMVAWTFNSLSLHIVRMPVH